MLDPLVGEVRLTVGEGFNGVGVGDGVGVGVGGGVIVPETPVTTSA